uniref:Retrovirus-related Pol polyprotein from transposon TNT 1-94 n=1 Tax=Cajanus cajan TaxID=3821 RepID=A0A151SHN8_CAJCA|nr:Retrovirus-related Pol polyprotein from transposon TNT 1-94 [Cajanus cajan]
MSHEFQSFLQNQGIISQCSCPSTLQQNGVAERKNHHLLDVVRILFLESSVPPRFWCEALSTAVYLINWLPSPTLQNVSPFFKLFGHFPSYSDLRIFSCVCFVHLPAHDVTNLLPNLLSVLF